MDSRTTMDKVRDLFRPSDVGVAYEALDSEPSSPTDATGGRFGHDGLEEGYTRRIVLTEDAPADTSTGEPFSWFEYSMFLLLGVAMLWAW